MAQDDAGQGGATQIGAVSFGIGIDLAQYERDLARAEQLARESAERTRRILTTIPTAVPAAQVAETEQQRRLRRQQAAPTAPQITPQQLQRERAVAQQRTAQQIPGELPAVQQVQPIELRYEYRFEELPRLPEIPATIPAQRQSLIVYVDVDRLLSPASINQLTTPVELPETRPIDQIQSVRVSIWRRFVDPGYSPPRLEEPAEIQQTQPVTIFVRRTYVDPDAEAQATVPPPEPAEQQIVIPTTVERDVADIPEVVVPEPDRQEQTVAVETQVERTLLDEPVLEPTEPPAVEQVQPVAVEVQRDIDDAGTPPPEPPPDVRQVQEVTVETRRQREQEPDVRIQDAERALLSASTRVEMLQAQLAEAEPRSDEATRLMRRIDRAIAARHMASRALQSVNEQIAQEAAETPIEAEQPIEVTPVLAAPPEYPEVPPPAPVETVQEVTVETRLQEAPQATQPRPVGPRQREAEAQYQQAQSRISQLRAQLRGLDREAAGFAQAQTRINRDLEDQLRNRVRARRVLSAIERGLILDAAQEPVEIEQQVAVTTELAAEPQLPDIPPPPPLAVVEQPLPVQTEVQRELVDEVAPEPAEPEPVEQAQAVTVDVARQVVDEPTPEPELPLPAEQQLPITVEAERELVPPEEVEVPQPEPVEQVLDVPTEVQRELGDVQQPEIEAPEPVEQELPVTVTPEVEVEDAPQPEVAEPEPVEQELPVELDVARTVVDEPTPAPAEPPAIQQTQQVTVEVQRQQAEVVSAEDLERQIATIDEQLAQLRTQRDELQGQYRNPVLEQELTQVQRQLGRLIGQRDRLQRQLRQRDQAPIEVPQAVNVVLDVQGVEDQFPSQEPEPPEPVTVEQPVEVEFEVEPPEALPPVEPPTAPAPVAVQQVVEAEFEVEAPAQLPPVAAPAPPPVVATATAAFADQTDEVVGDAVALEDLTAAAAEVGAAEASLVDTLTAKTAAIDAQRESAAATAAALRDLAAAAREASEGEGELRTEGEAAARIPAPRRRREPAEPVVTREVEQTVEPVALEIAGQGTERLESALTETSTAIGGVARRIELLGAQELVRPEPPELVLPERQIVQPERPELVLPERPQLVLPPGVRLEAPRPEPAPPPRVPQAIQERLATQPEPVVEVTVPPPAPGRFEEPRIAESLQETLARLERAPTPIGQLRRGAEQAAEPRTAEPVVVPEELRRPEVEFTVARGLLEQGAPTEDILRTLRENLRGDPRNIAQIERILGQREARQVVGQIEQQRQRVAPLVPQRGTPENIQAALEAAGVSDVLSESYAQQAAAASDLQARITELNTVLSAFPIRTEERNRLARQIAQREQQEGRLRATGGQFAAIEAERSAATAEVVEQARRALAAAPQTPPRPATPPERQQIETVERRAARIAAGLRELGIPPDLARNTAEAAAASADLAERQNNLREAFILAGVPAREATRQAHQLAEAEREAGRVPIVVARDTLQGIGPVPPTTEAAGAPQTQGPDEASIARLLRAANLTDELVDSYARQAAAAAALAERERALTRAFETAGVSKQRAASLGRQAAQAEQQQAQEAARLAAEQARTASVDPGAAASALRAAGVTEELIARYGQQAEAASRLATREQQLTQALETAGIERSRAAEAASQITRAENQATLTPIQRVRETLGSALQFSPGNIARFGLQVAGVSAGLSILASLGDHIHQSLAAGADAAARMAQSTRQIGANLGQPAQLQVQAGAEQFAQRPDVRGTTQEFLNAAQGLTTLQTQYGLTTQQVNELITASGRVARVQGVDLVTATTALGQAFQGNIGQAQELGLNLLDQAGRLRSVGISYQSLVEVVGRARAQQQLYADIQAEVARQQQNAAASSNATVTALDRIRRSTEQLQNTLTRRIAVPVFETVVQVAAPLAEDAARLVEQVIDAFNRPIEVSVPILITTVPQLQNLDVEVPSPRELLTEDVPFRPGAAGVAVREFAGTLRDQISGAVSQGVLQGLEVAQQNIPELREFIVQQRLPEVQTQQIQTAVETETAGLNALVRQTEFEQAQRATEVQAQQTAQAIETETAGLNALTRATEQAISAEDRHAISLRRVLEATSTRQLQARISDLESLQNLLQGPIEGPLGLTPEAQDREARRRADLERQRRSLQEETVRQLNEALPGGGETPAEAAAIGRQRQLINAEREQAAADLQGRIAQSRVDVLSAQSELRRLSVAGEQRNIQAQQLGIQERMASVLLREAEIRDQINVASRTNLELTERRLAAEEQALAAREGLEDVQFEQREAELLLTSDITNRLRGGGGLGVDAQEQINRIIDAALRQPEAELQALQAERPVTLVGREQAREDIRRQLTTIPLEREARGLEDILIPLRQQEREAQSQADALERRLQTQELAAGPEREAAERAATEARLRQAVAAGGIAQAQAALVQSQMNNNINVNITVPAGTEVTPGLTSGVRDAAISGTLEALERAGRVVPERVPVEVSGGR